MKNTKIKLLAALLMVLCISSGFSVQRKSRRQPVAERGFWVTETDPASKTTIIRFYATSNHLVSERKEDKELDVKRLAARKALNSALRKELEKDSLTQSLPKLYEVN